MARIVSFVGKAIWQMSEVGRHNVVRTVNGAALLHPYFCGRFSHVVRTLQRTASCKSDEIQPRIENADDGHNVWHRLEYSRLEEVTPLIQKVEVDSGTEKASGAVSITWADGSNALYPYIYLRDCCTCELCFHAYVKQRLADIYTIMDVNKRNLVELREVSLQQEGRTIHIEWEDDHHSSFDAKWLWERKLPKVGAEERNRSALSKHIWGNEISECIPEVSFEDLMTCDKSTYFFLNCLKQVGFILVRNSPIRPGVLLDISKRLQIHVRRTHYGEIFEIKANPEPNSLAYTREFIPLHVDLAYYKYHPGVQFLHCIQQSEDPEGGWSLLVDGFNIAERLRKSKREIFDSLTKRKFIFKDDGKDIYGYFKKEFARPIIELDKNGQPCHIAFNNFTRSSFFNECPEGVVEAYQGYYHWEEEIRKPENFMKFKLMPGDILCLDNIRVLHGRTGFSVESSRWLQGCYFDWDEINSAFAVVQDRIEQSDAQFS